MEQIKTISYADKTARLQKAIKILTEAVMDRQSVKLLFSIDDGNISSMNESMTKKL